MRYIVAILYYIVFYGLIFRASDSAWHQYACINVRVYSSVWMTSALRLHSCVFYWWQNVREQFVLMSYCHSNSNSIPFSLIDIAAYAYNFSSQFRWWCTCDTFENNHHRLLSQIIRTICLSIENCSSSIWCASFLLFFFKFSGIICQEIAC